MKFFKMIYHLIIPIHPFNHRNIDTRYFVVFFGDLP